MRARVVCLQRGQRRVAGFSLAGLGSGFCTLAGGEEVSLAMVVGVSGVENVDVDVFDRVKKYSNLSRALSGS